MVEIEFSIFSDTVFFLRSPVPLQAHFLGSFWDLNLGLGTLNPEKWKFGMHLKKRPEKHAKNSHARHARIDPGLPFKT